ncbi:MAG TPA: SDR family oxidoreductase [Nitrospirales bacterium]|nr:SDR family oxidoreductase [Nitrospirales bacterium]
MSFLGFEEKTMVVFGVANKKSVAYQIGQVLEAEGAEVVYVVRSKERKDSVGKLLPKAEIYVCDVAREEEILAAARDIGKTHPTIHGLVHSIAFLDYEGGIKPFHETTRKAFLQSIDISCYSLIAIANAFKNLLAPDASVIAVSISTTTMAAENYGIMGPVKAALDSTICFLAKSFSSFSSIRFNSVNPALLKTSASAGIPGYADYYLYAEKLTLRKKGVTTQEVANAAAFLLSKRSAGINAQGIVLDAGMSVNYFDKDVMRRAMKPD